MYMYMYMYMFTHIILCEHTHTHTHTVFWSTYQAAPNVRLMDGRIIAIITNSYYY